MAKHISERDCPSRAAGSLSRADFTPWVKVMLCHWKFWDWTVCLVLDPSAASQSTPGLQLASALGCPGKARAGKVWQQCLSVAGSGDLRWLQHWDWATSRAGGTQGAQAEGQECCRGSRLCVLCCCMPMMLGRKPAASWEFCSQWRLTKSRRAAFFNIFLCPSASQLMSQMCL